MRASEKLWDSQINLATVKPDVPAAKLQHPRGRAGAVIRWFRPPQETANSEDASARWGPKQFSVRSLRVVCEPGPPDQCAKPEPNDSQKKLHDRLSQIYKR